MVGICGDKSEKKDKQADNRRYRRREKEAIQHDKEIEVKVKDGNCTFAKDGKYYYKDGRKVRK